MAQPESSATRALRGPFGEMDVSPLDRQARRPAGKPQHRRQRLEAQTRQERRQRLGDHAQDEREAEARRIGNDLASSARSKAWIGGRR